LRVKRRYPLESLRVVSEHKTNARTRELASRLSERLAAERDLEHSRRERRTCEAKLSGVQRAERERLERGSARAGDLQAALATAEHLGRQLAALQAQEASRAERLEGERQAEGQAQRALAEAEASAKAVGRHHQTWQRAEAQRAENAQAEAALEVHVARSRPVKRGSAE
jgi:hypothetical protein